MQAITTVNISICMDDIRWMVFLSTVLYFIYLHSYHIPKIIDSSLVWILH